MKKRNLGNTDIKLTSIGFGGAPLGNLFEELKETDCFDIVKKSGPKKTDVTPSTFCNFPEILDCVFSL